MKKVYIDRVKYEKSTQEYSTLLHKQITNRPLAGPLCTDLLKSKFYSEVSFLFRFNSYFNSYHNTSNAGLIQKGALIQATY